MSESSNSTKNKFTYRLAPDGRCVVRMASTDTEETIVFPAEIDGHRVTTIGYRACTGCSLVKEIIVPEGITEIESFAFTDCPALTRVHLPATLMTVSSYLFSSGNAVSLITYPKGTVPRYLFEKERQSLAQDRRIVTRGNGAGEEDADGTVGIYEIPPYTEREYAVLYERDFTLNVTRLDAGAARAALAEVGQTYELIQKTVKTYDVYSSDGVDPNDRDTEEHALALAVKNLVFREGACCGIYYKDAFFDGVLFFDGTETGLLQHASRELCFGHPLDYYINTFQKLLLKKK